MTRRISWEKKKKKAAMRLIPGLFAVLLLLTAVPLRAEPFPAHGDVFVNDLSGVLPTEAEDRLRAGLERLKTDTGIEMTVLTIPTRTAYDAAPSIEAFAKGLFNAWGVGARDRNDGILILVVTNDREMRIALGAGYNQAYDVVAQDVADRYFLPAFRDGDYAAGIESGTAETIRQIARRHAERLPPQPVAGTGGSILGWIVGGAMVLIAGLAVLGRKVGDLVAGMRACPQCGQRGTHRHHETLREATRTEGGLRSVVTTCPSCGHTETTTETIPARGKRGGTGGSFGGGKSSGGGATGRW